MLAQYPHALERGSDARADGVDVSGARAGQGLTWQPMVELLGRQLNLENRVARGDIQVAVGIHRHPHRPQQRARQCSCRHDRPTRPPA